MTALIRNLATLTRVGVIAPGRDGDPHASRSSATRERLRQARVHPIAVLAALRTYASGRGVRGRHTWAPVAQVVDALDAAFYAAFGNVEPTGKRMLLALDVSGSMSVRPDRRRPGPDAARRVGGDGARDGGHRAAARDRRLPRGRGGWSPAARPAGARTG